MSFEEAVEALKARDPRLVVQLAKLCAAVDASKVANDPTPAWDRMEAAIVALVKSTGADDELLERQFREGHDAAGAGARKTTREDLDNVDLRYADGGIAFLQAAFARLLLSLPLGVGGTRAGGAAVGSLMMSENGFNPWLFNRAARPGGDVTTKAGVENLVIKGILAHAAELVIHSGRSRLDAITKAVAENGAKAMDRGQVFNPELLRQRSHRRDDSLHVYFEERLKYERDRKFKRMRRR